ncbi:alpha/beta fold hydrolase [Spongiimicrobium sp. 3-5]|uniref:alpha/beta hydrolase family protein n=1 Tax=Spongiimicrobium sp. 3-5 TaxID=3332596 RepID=UPI00397F5A13
MKKIKIITADNYQITAHRFGDLPHTDKTFVIAGGIGLPQWFFFNFAEWLSHQGCTAYIFDYRGISMSKPPTLKGMHATLHDWATKDFVALTDYVRKEHPNSTLFHVGHSFGGNSLGMATAYRHYTRFLMVGSQYGYYKNFPLHMQLSIFLGFGFLVPFLSPLLGYFPSNRIGLGHPLPKRVALDWATLLLDKGSVFTVAERYGENHYHNITQPILAISIDDDTFAPKKSVDVLAEKGFGNAAVTRLHLVPDDYGIKRLGHNNFFRKKYKEQLWPIVTEWFQI